jgi:hypothetical protein
MKSARSHLLFVVAILAPLLAGCGLVSSDEVARVSSPDGQLDAVLIETNGGATTSFGYEIHVVEKAQRAGNEVAWLYGAGRNPHAYGASLKWIGERELVIEYLDAREQRLEQGSTKVAGRTIHVSLRSGVSDPTAPPGGMLYNLERTRAVQ